MHAIFTITSCILFLIIYAVMSILSFSVSELYNQKLYQKNFCSDWLLPEISVDTLKQWPCRLPAIHREKNSSENYALSILQRALKCHEEDGPCR